MRKFTNEPTASFVAKHDQQAVFPQRSANSRISTTLTRATDENKVMNPLRKLNGVS